MTRAHILAKIRKCLALAASANEHEAAAAFAKAREMMEAHGVSADDVALADVFEERARRATSAARPPLWETSLIFVVADTFGVAPLLATPDVIFAGTGAAPTIAKYAFAMVRRILKANRAAYIKNNLRRCKIATKRARADHYCYGFVQGIRAEMSALLTAPVKCPLGEQWLVQRYQRIATVKARMPQNTRSARTFNDYQNGKCAGGNVKLHQGLGGSAQPERIGHDT